MNDSNIIRHVDHLFELNSRLAFNAFKCANWNIFFEVRDGNPTFFRWMPKLNV